MAKNIIEFKKYLNIWTTNVEYDKIINCCVIKPTHELDKWLYNTEFFLDKRYWLEQWVDGSYEYTDDIVIWWDKYYLFHNLTETFVWVRNNDTIEVISGPHNYDKVNPIKFAKWISANWVVKESNLVITWWATYNNKTWLKIINEDASYDDWYITLDIWVWHNIQAWDMVLFKDNIYKWWTVEIDLYEAWKIYILWIDAKGSIPLNWDTIAIYKETWICPVIWTADWVKVIHIDWTNVCESTNVLPWNIEDVVSFNEALFALKNWVIYNSTKTNDDTVQFYSASDRRRIVWSYKLLSKWKFLLVLWEVNKLITTSIENSVSFWEYSMYSLNYEWDLYSKDAFLFTDTSLYLLQRDRQLVHVN